MVRFTLFGAATARTTKQSTLNNRKAHLKSHFTLVPVLIAAGLLTGCANALAPSMINGSIETATLRHDLVAGSEAYVKGKRFPVYRVNNETTVFLLGNAANKTYGIVLGADGCHDFDGRNGFRSNSQTLGYIKDTCLAFCVNVEPKRICFDVPD